MLLGFILVCVRNSFGVHVELCLESFLCVWIVLMLIWNLKRVRVVPRSEFFAGPSWCLSGILGGAFVLEEID